MRALILLFVIMLCLSGCAQVVSDQSLRLVDRRISFVELRQDPERFVGKYFLLGGGIVAVNNTNEGGELEVVQFRTDESGSIISTADSGGRFLAQSAGFLDPALYRPGFLVTLVGEVQGKIIMRLDELDYSYPVLAIREIHLWKPEEAAAPPAFHFGIGVGTIIH